MTAVAKKAKAQMAAPVSEAAALIQMIENAARDPNVDIDKMERLFEMRTRVVKEEQQRQFNSDLSAAQAEIKPVVKDRDNNQTHSRYATLEAIANEVTPIITKYGFATTFTEVPPSQPGWVKTEGTLLHRSGIERKYYHELPPDDVGIAGKKNKTAVHAHGSAVTYNRRYILLMMFDLTITEEDDDGNGAGAAVIDGDQVDTLLGLINETGTALEKFLAAFKVESIEIFPQDRFGQAVAMLNKKKRDKANGD